MRAAVREHAVLFAPFLTPLAIAYCGTWARLSHPGPPMAVLLRATKSNAINAERLIIGVVQRVNVSLFNAAARTSPAPAAFLYCQAQLAPLFAQFVLQHSRVSGASNGEKYARSAVPYVTLPYMPSHMTLKIIKETGNDTNGGFASDSFLCARAIRSVGRRLGRR